MKTSKWWSLLPVALIALALAAPSMASASSLVEEQGQLVMSGSRVTFESPNGFVLGSSLFGEENCWTPALTLRNELERNDGYTMEFGGLNTGSGACQKGSSLTPYEYFTFSNIRSTQTGKGTANFTFEQFLPNNQVCRYVGTNVPFTYVSGTNILVFDEAKGLSSGACGAAKFSAKFQLTLSSSGQRVILK